MLQNLLSGACKVSLPAGQEALFGRMKCPNAADFRNQALYIWYDYFSVPHVPWIPVVTGIWRLNAFRHTARGLSFS